MKKAAADEKVEHMRTGGGTFIPKVDMMDDQILAILDNRAHPLPNVFDSDAAYNAEGEYSLLL